MATSSAVKLPAAIAFDIENTPVLDDPRDWSSRKKWACLAIISCAAAINGLAANLFFPALNALQLDLKVSDAYM